jgi:hypothetical protein
MRRIAGFVTLILAAMPDAFADDLIEQASVIDDDTIEIHGLRSRRAMRDCRVIERIGTTDGCPLLGENRKSNIHSLMSAFDLTDIGQIRTIG